MLNIVIPMAGSGTRFACAGYRLPKPLIDVQGAPMIRRVIDNIRSSRPHRFIFVCQRAHDIEFGLRDKLTAWAPGCEIVLLDATTAGAACTVLAAAALIDTSDSLMIANSDQYVDISIDKYLATTDSTACNGMIMTMPATDPKWSFAAIDRDGWVTRVAEKQPISPHATVGIYNFTEGTDFVAAARRMIAAQDRTRGEFYLAPVYNHLLEAGARIAIHEIQTAQMHGLGTPEDLQAFLAKGMLRQDTAA
jgi:dTDP-glucose pyrophosphorylase